MPHPVEVGRVAQDVVGKRDEEPGEDQGGLDQLWKILLQFNNCGNEANRKERPDRLCQRKE